MSHNMFSLLTYWFCPTNICTWGYNWGTTFQQNTAVLWSQKQRTLTRQRSHEECHIHLVHSSPTRGIFCTHAAFPWSLVTQERLLDTWPPRHMTSNFDACEVDLNMQMSFLSAAPFLCEGWFWWTSRTLYLLVWQVIASSGNFGFCKIWSELRWCLCEMFLKSCLKILCGMFYNLFNE